MTLSGKKWGKGSNPKDASGSGGRSKGSSIQRMLVVMVEWGRVALNT